MVRRIAVRDRWQQQALLGRREPVAEVGLETAATWLRDAGLRVSSVCRGGFFTVADPADRSRAHDENLRAVAETRALGAPTLVLVPGGLVAACVVDGQADVAIHQISEILAVPDAVLVGPLPAEIQNYTVYAGAVSAASANGDAVRALLAVLRSAQAAEILKAKGMEAP